jgi:hypothetical protein
MAKMSSAASYVYSNLHRWLRNSTSNTAASVVKRLESTGYQHAEVIIIQTYSKHDIRKCTVTASIPPQTINPELKVLNADIRRYFGLYVRLHQAVSKWAVTREEFP